jgi:hypothetical protein
LHDPYLGKLTQQKFLEKWEAILQSKEFWLNRDRTASVNHELLIRDIIFENITAAADFLQVSREVLLVGILADKALRSTLHDEIDPATIL